MKRFAVLALAAAVCLASCGGEAEETTEGAGPKVIYTTFYPTTWMTERMVGDLAEVVCPVPDDEDAIFWTPPPEVLAKYQAADLIVVNGAQFEKWVLKLSLPEGRVLNTAKPFEDKFLRFKDAVTHSHGPSGAHAHEGVDGHTWLDPHQAKAQAAAIRDRLVLLLPDHAEEIRGNYDALAADLDELDEELRAATEGYEGQRIFASHPAYNYIARRYGWNIVNLSLDPESMPDEESLAQIAKKKDEDGITHLLWESAPLEEIEDRMAEMGLESVVFSPCELMPAEEIDAGRDYLTVMRENVANIRPALKR
jgi:zinc transport system substrate-binding protein